MMLRRAAWLVVGDVVRIEGTGPRVLWKVAKVQRPIDAAGRPEVEVMLAGLGERTQFAFRCFTDDLIEVMPQPTNVDVRGRK
jgi:hypothetical protein